MLLVVAVEVVLVFTPELVAAGSVLVSIVVIGVVVLGSTVAESVAVAGLVGASLLSTVTLLVVAVEVVLVSTPELVAAGSIVVSIVPSGEVVIGLSVAMLSVKRQFLSEIRVVGSPSYR